MRKLDRDIIALALPALGALIAEPIFLMADTAMVGHLGSDALAGLALASVVLQTVLGLMIFLAYATTPRVARLLGAGNQRAAISAGFDGMWLALLVSGVLLGVGLPLLKPVLGLFNATAPVLAASHSYLLISWWGLPLMLVVIAATGLLRGLQDTKTPLVIAAVGFGLNIMLNAIFIYGFGLGVAGSALGTVCAHAVMCAIYVTIAVRAARTHRATLLPNFAGVWQAAKTSGWLLLRNVSLRASLITLIVLATALGTVPLAALHITQTLFNALALVLDALAIAGQAMVGLYLGRGNRSLTLATHKRLQQFGIGFGAIMGILLAGLAPVLGPVFTSDPDVAQYTIALNLVLALSLPVAGYVFTLDGILMGAQDTRYLALAQLLSSAGFIVLAVVFMHLSASITVLWASFCIGFMTLRAMTLGLRMRGTGWVARAEALARP